MHLSIFTQEKKIFEGPVYAIHVTSNKGPFQIKKNHAPLISIISKEIKIENKKDQYQNIKIKEAILEVKDNQITILVQKNVLSKV